MSNQCSIKQCDNVAFYRVKSKFFCENHKELSLAYARLDLIKYDEDKARANNSSYNDFRLNLLSKIK